jgi:hypothetical protein
MAAKKAPAKKAPAKKSPAPRSANAAEKDMMNKKAKSRTDAQGRSGMGASYPRKSKVDSFWDSVGGKTLIATNPVLGAASLISAGERRVRKKLNKKAYTDE